MINSFVIKLGARLDRRLKENYQRFFIMHIPVQLAAAARLAPAARFETNGTTLAAPVVTLKYTHTRILLLGL